MLEQITSAAYQYFLWLFSFHSKILWKHKETHVIYQYFNDDIQNCKIGKSCTQYQNAIVMVRSWKPILGILYGWPCRFHFTRKIHLKLGRQHFLKQKTISLRPKTKWMKILEVKILTRYADCYKHFWFPTKSKMIFEKIFFSWKSNGLNLKLSTLMNMKIKMMGFGTWQ